MGLIEKMKRKDKGKYRAIDFIIEDMRLMQNFAEYIKKSGKVEIFYKPGCFHITSEIKSSSHGFLNECIRGLTPPEQLGTPQRSK